MDLKLDSSKEYGIVLEGGGAKGSYQIGAWKALREAGIQIKGIAGTSVGALNGALICMDALEQAEEIWSNLERSQIMDVEDRFFAEGKRLFSERGIDISPLKNLIEEIVDEEKIRQSGRDLFVSTISVTDRKPLIVDVKEVPPGKIKDMLLASAYLPIFKRERLGGKLYTDGGGANNVPIDALTEHGYKNILIIRIYGLGYDTEKRFSVPDDVSVYHIAPRQNLGGILKFDKKRARKNQILGYFDGKRLLYGLAGRWYYLDAPGSERDFFDKLIQEITWLMQYLSPLFSFEMPQDDICCRSLFELVFPELARKLSLAQDWDYRDLYLGILEYLAKKLRISRFQVYTDQELLLKIHQKLRRLDSGFQI